MPRYFVLSTRKKIALGLFGALGLVALSGAPAFADPVYNKGSCVINRLVDGPVAGGSQCAGADLGGAHLAQAALQGADLTGTNLAKADIQAASLVGARIEGANFTGARVVGADLTGTGIFPPTIDVVSPTATGAPVEFQPILPQGLTLKQCTIAGEPVASGAVFPVGTSTIVCSLNSSRSADEDAIALVKIAVTTPDVAPIGPTFTEIPLSTERQSGMSVDTAMAWVIGGGALLLVGVITVIIAGVRRNQRHY